MYAAAPCGKSPKFIESDSRFWHLVRMPTVETCFHFHCKIARRYPPNFLDQDIEESNGLNNRTRPHQWAILTSLACFPRKDQGHVRKGEDSEYWENYSYELK